MTTSEIERLGAATSTDVVVQVLQIENIAFGWPKISNGIFYFATRDAAGLSAKAADWPTDRLIQYGLGWAVQAGPSGNYFGPGGNAVPRPWGGA